MLPSDKLTVPQKLLVAAASVSERSKTFSAEDLIVESWRLFPDTFGLAGYSDRFPDSNRVLTQIMGTKGMRGKGWIEKIAEKQYRLTAKGMTEVSKESATASTPDPDNLRAELDRRTAVGLERVVQTTAARKALEDDEASVTFYDACGFWDITARSNANTLAVRLSETELLLKRALEAVERHGSHRPLQLARATVSASHLTRLLKLHYTMIERFQTELDVIRRRVDERLERKRNVITSP